MGQRIYIDTTTKELVVWSPDDTVQSSSPGFTEAKRNRDSGSGRVTITALHGVGVLVNNVRFSDAETEAGVAYASLDAFWDALTPFFTTA